MHRRGDELSGRLLPALLISLLGIGALITAGAFLAVAARDSPPPLELPRVPTSTSTDGQAVDAPDRPTITITEFYPESANLSDCVGLVEQPGCGSGSRGGWHQTAVFAVLFVGLGVVLWRVSRGIRANRAVLDADIDAGAHIENETERS